MDAIAPWFFPAAVSGICSGLIFYGALRVELRWLRRDVDYLLTHIDPWRERRETPRT